MSVILTPVTAHVVYITPAFTLSDNRSLPVCYALRYVLQHLCPDSCDQWLS